MAALGVVERGERSKLLTDYFQLDDSVHRAGLLEIHSTPKFASISGLYWIDLQEGRYVMLVEVHSICMRPINGDGKGLAPIGES